MHPVVVSHKIIAMKQTVNVSSANDLHLLELPQQLKHSHFLFSSHPSHSYAPLICSGITQQHIPLSIPVFVCLSMSILLKRDMSPSPRKLPQARKNTTA